MVLADINNDAAGLTAEALVAAGHKALAVRCYVVDEAAVAAMVDRTVAAFGRLDPAFNNAGVQVPAIDGKVVAWLEKVTDGEYLAAPLA